MLVFVLNSLSPLIFTAALYVGICLVSGDRRIEINGETDFDTTIETI